MNTIAYRGLAFGEAPLIGTIDRSEAIDGVYRLTNEVLEFIEAPQDVLPWSRVEVEAHVARLQRLMQAGGRVLSAWDERRLVAIGSLDTSGVGADEAIMKLDMLYVSATYRGRGIGRALTEQAAEVAKSLGASALYISATPTRGTVDAYLRVGARVLANPDPVLFGQEPEDIHLILNL